MLKKLYYINQHGKLICNNELYWSHTINHNNTILDICYKTKKGGDYAFVLNGTVHDKFTLCGKDVKCSYVPYVNACPHYFTESFCSNGAIRPLK